VRLVERLVERSDLARQRLDPRLNLERLLGRGVVIRVVRGGELGLELVTLRSRSASSARRFSISACTSADGLGRGRGRSIRHRHDAALRLRVAQLLDQRVALDDLAAERSEPVAYSWVSPVNSSAFARQKFTSFFVSFSGPDSATSSFLRS
jgi:hypothetical protein